MGGGLEGNMAMGGGAQGVQNGYGGNIVTTGPWWTAFGPGGVEGEPPLLEGEQSFTHITLFLSRLNVWLTS
jgi:protein YIPF5/7